jgi:copper oxidase (laccase) domain-containing protein
VIETIQKESALLLDEPDIFSPERKDWRQTEHPFTVAVSVATTGPSRETGEWQTRRAAFAGNMSESYAQPDRRDLDEARANKQVTPEQKSEMSREAQEHTARFIESCGYDPDHTAVLRPQTDYSQPLSIVDVDQVMSTEGNNGRATWLNEPGDFIYTRDPEKVLGCRPADCPVLVIKGEDGNGQNVLSLLHVGWQGLNAGYLEDAMVFLRNQGMDFSTLRVYVGPAANKENYPYSNEHDPRGTDSPRFTHDDRDKLFVDVRQNPDTDKYDFAMDMPGFINYMLTSPDRIGLKPEQVAFDGSDVAAFDSGYSSHSRVRLTGEVNTRDIIIASMGEPQFNK